MSESHRVGFWDRNPPVPWPCAATAGKQKGQSDGGSRSKGPNGRGRGRREAGGGRRQESRPSRVAKCGLSRTQMPERARASSTYPAWVEPSAGARVSGIRHGSDCAAASRRALPHRPRGPAAPERTTPPGGGHAPPPAARTGFRSCLGPCQRPFLSLCFICRRRASSKVG